MQTDIHHNEHLNHHSLANNPTQELQDLKVEVAQDAPRIDARFEVLNDANMPEGITRYRIRKTAVDGKLVNGMDIMGNFFECSAGQVNFNFKQGKNLSNYIQRSNNKTALITPIPFVGEDGTTEGLRISEGTKNTSNIMNYRGDNALVRFKDGKSGIIKVKIGTNDQKKNNLMLKLLHIMLTSKKCGIGY